MDYKLLCNCDRVLYSLCSLFLEILNDCSDVDEIKFQEDGTWCPMRPKKESVKVPTQSIPKTESKCMILNLGYTKIINQNNVDKY